MIRLVTIRKSIASVCVVLLLALGLVARLSAVHADAILEVNDKTVETDLAKSRSPVAAERAKISLQGPSDPKPVSLEARGPGPTYFWSLFSFRNTSDHALEFVLDVQPQRFVGSGLLPVHAPTNLVLNATATNGQTLVQEDNTTAYAFRVSPGETFNIAMESPTVELQASLWPRQLWQARQSQISFFNGLVLGVSLLAAFGVLAIYGFRPHAAFLSAAIFAMAGLVFASFESGHLAGLADFFARVGIDDAVLRSLVETSLAASLALVVLNFTNVTRTSPVIGFGVLFLGGLMLANGLYALAEPVRANTVARLGFAILAFGGMAITFARRKRPERLVDPDLIFWISLCGWTIFAGVLCFFTTSEALLSPLLQATLAATMVMMVTVLLKFMFAQGLNAKPFITDSSRRSLALSSAGHTLWEWQPEQNILSVSEDLPRSLGGNPADWQPNAQNALINLLHPQDIATYMSVIESVDKRPGLMVLRELRLRNSTGAFRWYLLRARWVPGPNQRLDRCIGTLTDITKSKEAEERQATNAVQDTVTALPNRLLFIDRVDRELAKTVALPFRVMLIDIDRFKVLNDALGHDYGDQLLKIAGSRIGACIEPDETVARVSGSQFAVLAVDAIARRNTNALAKQINAALGEPIKLHNQDISLSASIGVSRVSARELSAQDMMQQATTALLEARRRGGGKPVNFDGDLKDERAAELSLESDLRRAVSNDEIEVHYQPISYLNTLEIAGFEALARWRHPTQGLLPPLQFIELAEKSGLINEIGQIVLAAAARQLGIWQRVHRRDRFFFVAVNVSASHLMDKEFPQQVQDAINREGLSLGSLKIEVTESVIMRQPLQAAKILEQLRTLGVGLACDDFGTGFSSLASLRDLPFDTLKIDRSFIAPDSYDDRSAMIVTTITELAHRLNMVVVAEGIETQEQIDNLAALGCDLGQGYLIGQPVTATEVSEMLQVLPRKLVDDSAAQSSPSAFGQFGKRMAVPPSIEPAVAYTPQPEDLDEALEPYQSPLRLGMPETPEDDYADEDMEPEALPSIFAVPRDEDEAPSILERKVIAKKPPPRAKPKAKAKPTKKKTKR